MPVNAHDRQRKATVLAAVIAIATWLVPMLRPIVLPLLYLNTHLHELCPSGGAVENRGASALHLGECRR